jgi:hypothetical protein
MDFLIQSFGEKFEYGIWGMPRCQLNRELVSFRMGKVNYLLALYILVMFC